MTNEELLAKFNPDNAPNLQPGDLEELRALSDQQIDVLADAYPNPPNRKAYLILFDKAVDPKKQLHQLSTWQNLRNVRKYSGKKNLIPWSFKSIFDLERQPMTGARQRQQTPAGSAKKVVVDLSQQEAKTELDKVLEQRRTVSAENQKGAATATKSKTPTTGTKSAQTPSAKPTAKTPAAAPKPVAKAPEQEAEGADTEFSDGTAG